MTYTAEEMLQVVLPLQHHCLNQHHDRVHEEPSSTHCVVRIALSHQHLVFTMPSILIFHFASVLDPASPSSKVFYQLTPVCT